MDNCFIHHLYDGIRLIYSVGALVLFLPPYSPDLMPIEECFSKVKHFLRLHQAVAQSARDTKLLITAVPLMIALVFVVPNIKVMLLSQHVLIISYSLNSCGVVNFHSVKVFQ